MTRIGVTGHRVIPDAVMERVLAGMREELVPARAGGPVEAFTNLAAGSDQLFAEVALDHGIPVTAVIPGTDYEQQFSAEELVSYQRLLKACTDRIDLPTARSDEQAYYEAGTWIVDHVDRLLAVWDGRPARGLGGTGDIVAYARRTGVPVTVLWSPGARRD
ncbi:hypothetical protein [Streptomyces sp. GC420]|uniref:hypothetical protein n=1 Tax=Streptomyces sp. GC420 TaxID=2697568 RepID=UPI0014150D57|nr:hypothetical protein [Streptomyces sp. GC420]NBM17049.1 hypothetical protein [Streptomyces sp. GC420]